MLFKLRSIPYIQGICMLVCIPFFLGWFLQEATVKGQFTLLYILIGWFTVASLMIFIKSRRRDTHPVRMWLVTGILLFFLLASILWNRYFFQIINQSGFRLDVFREPVRTLHAPLYGLSQILHQNRYTFIIISVLLFAFSWIWVVPILSGRQSQFFLAAFQVLLLLAFCFTDGMPRFEAKTVHFATFSEGLPYFKDISDLLRYYVSTMGRMGVHNDHYPPGNLILLFIEQQLHSRHVLIPFLVILSGLCTLVLGKTLSESGANANQVLFTQGLFITMGNGLVYTTIDFSAITMLLMASGIYFTFRYFRKPTYINALFPGLLLTLFLFFSFTASLLFLFLFIFLSWLLVSKSISMATVIKFCVTQLVVILLFYSALWFVFGFDEWNCFQTARIQSRQLLQSNSFDQANRYLIRSTGNLLGFALGSGLVSVALLIIATSRKCISLRQQTNTMKLDENLLLYFPISCLLLIVLASFSGLFFMETERVWTCLIPLVALAGGTSYDFFSKQERHVLIISAIFTACVLELCWSQN